jgi:glutaredoxin-like protein
MSFIPPEQTAALAGYLAARLVAPVTLDLLARSGGSDEARLLLEEVAALSGQITLRVHDRSAEPSAAGTGAGADERPAILLGGAARGRVRFLGSPLGLEFPTLLNSIIDVGRGDTGLMAATKQALRALAGDVHIRVFVTPTCPFCPRAAQIAHRMAVHSPRVTADVIEAQEFPALAERYRVQGVPKVVVNEVVEFVGTPSEAGFLGHVLRAAA